MPVSLITGCASGIGRRLAERLASDNHTIIATDIDLDGVRELADEQEWSESDAMTAGLDVRDPAAWDKVIDAATERLGPLDYVFNVAGYLKPARVHDIEVDDVDRHFDINVKGVIYGTRAAARRMVPRGSGHIINVASLAGVAPVPGLCLYSASKFAVRGFSLSAAMDLRPHGVAVTAVCPDAVQTPMLELQVDYEEAALTFSGSKPLTVDDVCDVIVGRVIRKRPNEVLIPLSRGGMAKFASAFPGVGTLADPLLRAKGRRAQAKAKKHG